ncbi:MAG: protoporphyrin/coproporphyrin ferrochelatase [Gemmatimonadales bacterium]|jgi:ferrochelatase|nr:protoporphyrin/coproporphyrin ferrochelatase [Gemmatimonadales bacterium]
MTDVTPNSPPRTVGAGSAGPRVKTGIVMMNLGGPATLDDVEPFLLELFADREIIQLPFQRWLGPFIARRRTPKVRNLYASIGGGSPILRYTEAQGRGMVARLDRISPETAPHKFYVAFRYAQPKSDDALRAMQADGVERAIAFTQYPQFSCSTTGSSLNELWRAAARTGLRHAFEWSVIDRWPVHEGFIDAMTETVREGMEQFAPADRDKVLILFSAHSLPLDVIDRGDAYPQEVGASVQRVVEKLGRSNPYILAYQSDVGPVRWLGPGTEQVLRRLGARGHKHVLVIPIAFTSDHIETLSELDREYGEVAHQAGIQHYKRAPALNDRPLFLDGLAQIVRDHLATGLPYSSQYLTRCAGCTNPQCRNILNPVGGAVRSGRS